jgi:hypothetical protein
MLGTPPALMLRSAMGRKESRKTTGKQKKEEEGLQNLGERVTDEPTHCPIRGLLSKWKREVEERELMRLEEEANEEGGRPPQLIGAPSGGLWIRLGGNPWSWDFSSSS